MPKKKLAILSKEHIKNSERFKKLFLLYFTKELIMHSGAGEVFELGNIVEKEIDEKKQEIKKEKKKIKQIIKEKKEFPFLEKEKFPLFKPLIKLKTTKPRILRIPEPRLPMRLQYLKPTPTNIQIDLEKLNPLIKDPMIKIIECNGPDENIIVVGTMGRKKTNIILSQEEINEIIKKFSETAKIPANEGIFRVVVGRLILLSIISEVIGSKFIIKKMMYAPIRNLRK